MDKKISTTFCKLTGSPTPESRSRLDSPCRSSALSECSCCHILLATCDVKVVVLTVWWCPWGTLVCVVNVVLTVWWCPWGTLVWVWRASAQEPGMTTLSYTCLLPLHKCQCTVLQDQKLQTGTSSIHNQQHFHAFLMISNLFILPPLSDSGGSWERCCRHSVCRLSVRPSVRPCSYTTVSYKPRMEISPHLQLRSRYFEV